ncbi:GNAT family N-acetyltransferase [Pseudomonas matsuisoli]|uniref:N-acetyltransferase n=1 Tax=Pseudomonas matsuisoli TaxID=1515666 RepID=A0A917PS72_9PSED|nr:GNAT family protein [Pseudomonas matsuisoli]GGJ89094.1 N-acetyltransferase [Pseudomonas matsuisoli]
MSTLNWSPARTPEREILEGRFCTLEPLDAARHGDDLWESFEGAGADPKLWDYLFAGPFENRASFDDWLMRQSASKDPQHFAIMSHALGKAVGSLSLMNIVPANGSIEIGNVTYGATMQRTPISTEAIFLLARYAFDRLGNRRLEWKCDDRNARSKRSAERFGFTYEGTFRQHMVIKGHNRDTAWFAIIDGDWPVIRAGFERWLAAKNFDEGGVQRERLEALR